MDYIRKIGYIPQNPLDTFVGDQINRTVSHAIHSVGLNCQFKVYTDWNHEDACHLQTMGELTSIALYYPPPVMWSAHPIYGIWFAFRAVVVFDGIEAPELTIPKPPQVSYQLNPNVYYNL